jgi:hypothetical protein
VKISKGEGYVCVFLRPGYWETGVLRDFLQGNPGDNRDLPAYFWADNCDYDPMANCYQFRLPVLYQKDVTDDLYIPHEYVLALRVHADKPDEMGKIGFQPREAAIAA